MSILELIKKRRSIRTFQDLRVEEEKLQNILEAALWAPCSGNLQPWKFIVVKDHKKKEEIVAAAFNQEWLIGSPVIIIVCGETEKVKKYYGIRGEHLYVIQDCAAAVQNILLEAESEGLASCWVGAFDEDKLKRSFDIPDKARPQAIIAIGYSGEKIPTPAKKDLRSAVFFEKFGEREIKRQELLPIKDSLSFAKSKIKEKAEKIKQKLVQKQS